MSARETDFLTFCTEKYIDEKRTSKTLRREEVDQIINFLSNNVNPCEGHALAKFRSKSIVISIVNNDNDFPSWRRTRYEAGLASRRTLSTFSGIGITENKVVFAITRFIQNILPSTVEQTLMNFVLLPEVVIRLLMTTENIGRLEAEFMLIDICSGRVRNYLLDDY